MKQMTLISLYGSKPKKLQEPLKVLCDKIQSSNLKSFFKPYNLDQIHGTIIGMEKLPGSNDFYNANIWREFKNKRKMDFDPLIDVLYTHLPITIRIGGFDSSYKGFMSLDRKPYERSFQIQWSTRKVTLIGWPHEDEEFRSKNLWLLRKDIEEKCNIRHKYAKLKDNDFFMVLGELTGFNSLSEQELRKLRTQSAVLEENIRQYLSYTPIDIQITSKDVFIALYENEALPLESTKIYGVEKHGANNSFIKTLYKLTEEFV